MGTTYMFYKDKNFGELSTTEMSNRLSFIFQPVACFEDSPDIYCSNDMTPKELAKIMLEGLTVCSYWMDTDELKELIKDHMYHNIY